MKPVAIFRHSPEEGPGYFATFLDRHAQPWKLLCIDSGTQVPSDPRGFSGLAFMGGPMSVNDPLPWVEQECTLIRAAVAQGIPVLGHCLGGQLMAKALGGMVSLNPEKEIGWGAVSVIGNVAAHEWFGEKEGFLAFHWHGETFSLPPGAARILESRHCANQAFVLGPHLGMQCHIEMTQKMIEQWCVIGFEEIKACAVSSVQRVEEIQTDMAPRLTALNAVADLLYKKWIAGLKRN